MGAEFPGAASRLPGFPAPKGAAGPGIARYAGLPALSSSVLCAVYGICVLFLLSFRYSRTVSMELFFFAFWALALAAEPLRLESLRGAVFGASFPERNIITRAIVSARFLGVFSLFAGSLYAVGFDSEKQETSISVVLLCSLALGTGLPVNTGSFGPDLLQRIGYGALQDFLSGACFLGACADYLLAVRVTGEKGYRAAALGCALTFLGGFLLRRSASMASVLAGAALLAFGTWFFIRKIHAYYLWQ